MSRRKKEAEPDSGEIVHENIKGSQPSIFAKAILAGVNALYNEHEPELTRVIEKDSGVTIQFTANIDTSEVNPLVEVKLRFGSQSVTDKRIVRLSDPNQTTFNFVRSDEFETEELGLYAREG